MKLIFTILLSVFSTHSIAGSCGDISTEGNGSYDYTSPDKRKLIGVVERRHFTKRVEMLKGGESTSEIMADLHYTLRKFPNHYRALQSLMKYEKMKGELPQTGAGFHQSVDCYFNRAFQLKPDDWRLFQLYGIYKFSNENFKEATENFIRSSEINPTAEIYYNIGISYFKMGELENSKEYAKKAYTKNYPLPGLKNMLKRKGIYIDEKPKE